MNTNTQKGFIIPLLIIAAALIVAGGAYVMWQRGKGVQTILNQATTTNSISDTSGLSTGVIFPNGGETLTIGMLQNITWSPSVSASGRKVDIKLVRYYDPCPSGAPCATAPAPYLIANGVSDDAGIFSWKVGTYLPFPGQTNYRGQPVNPGLYTIEICQSSTNDCVSGNNYFTITN